MIDLPIAEPKPQRQARPDWLRVKLPIGEDYKRVRSLVDTYNLHTICQSGNCPNMGECWGEGTATFMILGNVCTRSCSFCAVKTGRPNEYDTDELNHALSEVAREVEEEGLNSRVVHKAYQWYYQKAVLVFGTQFWIELALATKQT